VDADFASIVERHVVAGADTIVELGSGVSTLLIAALLAARGSGHLYSVDHDGYYAEETLLRLEQLGLTAWVTMITAPLTEHRFAFGEVVWYSSTDLVGLDKPIDLVVVDGPPSQVPRARWPAMHYLYDALSSRAVILLDDGRRGPERATALAWAREYRDLELFWIDTIKGAWEMRKCKTACPKVHMSRRLLRQVNPCPSGFGLAPIRR
jgi:predicted O-methyltransferase YrrM